MVRRRECESRIARQLAQHGHPECRALSRVGAGAHLIKEHEALGARVARRPRVLQDAPDARDVRGEGRERLDDTLVIADIGHDALKEGELRRAELCVARLAEDAQPRARHQRSEPERLEHHRLAAGVGAGDDDRTHLRACIDV